VMRMKSEKKRDIKDPLLSFLSYYTERVSEWPKKIIKLSSLGSVQSVSSVGTLAMLTNGVMMIFSEACAMHNHKFWDWPDWTHMWKCAHLLTWGHSLWCNKWHSKESYENCRLLLLLLSNGGKSEFDYFWVAYSFEGKLKNGWSLK